MPNRHVSTALTKHASHQRGQTNIDDQTPVADVDEEEAVRAWSRGGIGLLERRSKFYTSRRRKGSLRQGASPPPHAEPMGGGADNGGGAASALLKVQLNSSFFLTFNDYQFLTVETLALQYF